MFAEAINISLLPERTGTRFGYHVHYFPPRAICCFTSENQFSTSSMCVIARSGSTICTRKKRDPSGLIVQQVLPLMLRRNLPSLITRGAVEDHSAPGVTVTPISRAPF